MRKHTQYYVQNKKKPIAIMYLLYFCNKYKYFIFARSPINKSVQNSYHQYMKKYIPQNIYVLKTPTLM